MANHPTGKKKKVSVSELKAHALQIIEHMRTSKKEVEVYKRGKLVARIIPVLEEPKKKFLGGGEPIIFNCTMDELMEPIDVKWNAESGSDDDNFL